MENKIAIDIVLLLSNETNDIICDFSKKIVTPKDLKPYVLDNINYIPHISLLMGVVTSDKLNLVKEKIKPILNKYLPLEITFDGLIKNKFPGLEIKKTKELVNLQKDIAEAIHLDYDATRDMFFDADISDQGIEWINKFRENNINDGKYNIHITLGLGDIGSLDFNLPIKTTINTAAVCHIGYGCSCRKILAKIVV